MLAHITPLYEIEQEALQIDSFLNITISEDMNECTERGSDLIVYMARSGKLLADAKYHLDKVMQENIIKEFGQNAGLAPSILKQLIEASCKNENYIVNWIERINRTCTHQLDWLRTIISKTKEEIKYQNFNK
jgi:hypothetical protein